MKQEIDEPIIEYLHCLQNVSRYCEFEKLRQEAQTTEEDLIQLRLIEGMYNASHRYKIMEQLQIRNMSLNTCIDFIQQQELIQKYKYDKSQPSEQIFADTYMLKKLKNVHIVDMNMKYKGKNAQHFRKVVQIALKNIFKQYANSKRKTLKKLRKMKQI